MVDSDNLRYAKITLNNGSGAIPALGFGTLIPDPVATRTATKAALEVGFRQFDAAERYRNEKEVGEAMQEVFEAGKIKRAPLRCHGGRANRDAWCGLPPSKPRTGPASPRRSVCAPGTVAALIIAQTASLGEFQGVAQ
jgi:hypothetical protein